MLKIITEALILKSQDFREKDQILTLFSPEDGIIKCLFKRKRNLGPPPISPLIKAEFVLSGRNPDFLSCDEISIISYHLEIRKNLEMLNAACQMLSGVGKTQLSGKPAPLLYTLLVKYLETLPQAPFPETLSASFFLKLIRHEGSLGQLGFCSVCGAPLESLFFSGGESFCKPHAKRGALYFNEQELAAMQCLLYSQKIGEITAQQLTPSFQEKLKAFFEKESSH